MISEEDALADASPPASLPSLECDHRETERWSHTEIAR